MMADGKLFEKYLFDFYVDKLREVQSLDNKF